jgi:hypothetical protein
VVRPQVLELELADRRDDMQVERSPVGVVRARFDRRSAARQPAMDQVLTDTDLGRLSVLTALERLERLVQVGLGLALGRETALASLLAPIRAVDPPVRGPRRASLPEHSSLCHALTTSAQMKVRA